MIEETPDTRIMIMNVHDNTIGMVVDSVSEVMRLNKDKVSPPPPNLTTKVHKDFIEGVGKVEERLIILLNLEGVLLDGGDESPLPLYALSNSDFSCFLIFNITSNQTNVKGNFTIELYIVKSAITNWTVIDNGFNSTIPLNSSDVNMCRGI